MDFTHTTINKVISEAYDKMVLGQEESNRQQEVINRFSNTLSNAGCFFSVGMDGGDEDLHERSIESAYTKLEKVAQDDFYKTIEDDPEVFGITLHDDSDMSDEGYGPYKWYDEEEMIDRANEMAADACGNLWDAIASTAEEFFASGTEDFEEWALSKGLKEEPGDDFAIIEGKGNPNEPPALLYIVFRKEASDDSEQM